MSYPYAEYLIDCTTLKQKLGNDNLRIFDTAVFLAPQPGGTYTITSGREGYATSHIPGAGFIDLVDGWADPESDLRFTLPDRDTLNERIGQSGIAADHEVVLYSTGHLMWATRAFWLLYHAGHTNLKVLNGNFSL